MAYAPLHYSSPPPLSMEPFPYSVEPFPYSAKSEIPLTQKDSFLDYPSMSEGPRPPPKHNDPKHNAFVAVLVFIWKTLFLPAMGLAYLAFCYSAHYKIIKIGGISNPMEHLPIIKAGVTSISIIFVSISLLPLYNLISDLKSEEFFRVLSGKHSGAPLNTVNSISTPSYGIRDSLVTLYRQNASTYFAGAFFASLVAIAASTLAPAALSVDTVLFDTDIVALSVGSLQRNTLVNSSDFANPTIVGPSNSASVKASMGGSIAWAEISLNVNFSFQSPTMDQTTYIVPTPSKLTPDVAARWLTDVIAAQPSCEWIAPQFQTTNVNFSDFSSSSPDSIIANLTSKNIQVKLDTFTLGSEDGFAAQQLKSSWFEGLGAFGGNLVDLDTMDDITNGASALVLFQCVQNCTAGSLRPMNITFGSDISSSRYTSTDGKTLDISVLYCAPNVQIQTRYISNDGKGFLSVGDAVPTVQGNLHPVQTNLMLSYAMSDLSETGSATSTNISTLGNQMQFSLMFGNPDLNSPQLTPLPIDQITGSYGRLLKSVSKPFIDGSLASAYVPARTTREMAVFASSLPHIIASTVIYALLSAFVLVCYFRRQVPQFTFFAVAASLASSEIPPLFAQMKESEKGRPSNDGAVATLGKSRVMFEGGQVLKLRSDS